MNWNDLQQSSLDQILGWAETRPWCEAMAACAQDAEWHAEGDVWTHTKMVCRQLTELEDWPELSHHERTLLVFTALFHDSAKPLTTQVDPETGRVTTPKHAVKGEHLARGILRDLGCDVVTREVICMLVRYHGRPCFLLERDDPAFEVVKLSWLLNNQLLYQFALADTRGRDTDSMSRPEENLHFWKMIAEEQNCFTAPYPFGNDHARFLFYRTSEPNLHYIPHEEYSCTVTMMSGLPGSGKDTWIDKHKPEHPIVSLDELREELDVEPTDNQGEVVQIARERCRELLRVGTDFVFNATNIQRQMRQRWIDLFADYRARVEIVYVEPPFETILQQNRRRESSVPEKVIRDLASRCEPPNWTECHRLTIVD